MVALFLLAFWISGCGEKKTGGPVLPSGEQVRYQEMEFVGFIHFTVNTFTDKEWGFGDEDPAIFNPAELNAEQWARERGTKDRS